MQLARQLFEAEVIAQFNELPSTPPWSNDRIVGLCWIDQHQLCVGVGRGRWTERSHGGKNAVYRDLWSCSIVAICILMRSSISMSDRYAPKYLWINNKIAFVQNEMVAHVDLCSFENKMKNNKTAWRSINFNRLKLQIQLKGMTLFIFFLLFSWCYSLLS